MPKSKRRKIFTDGRQTPIDRNDRARVMWLAEMARRSGKITSAGIDVLRALLYQFANFTDGRCFPSYARLAKAAGRDPSTVGRVLPDLEAVGLVTWVNRLTRVKERVDLGHGVIRWRTQPRRTSNAYDFPLARKNPAFAPDTQNGRGTDREVSPALDLRALDPENPLYASLMRLGEALGYITKPNSVAA